MFVLIYFLSSMLFADDYQNLVNLLEYKNESPRKVFGLCKKIGIDCTYFKAKVLESEGSAGSAMDLYLRGGYFGDYIRLQTYSGADIEPLLKKYNIEEKKATFYLALSEFTRGHWQSAADLFSKKILKGYDPAKFYLAYSFLMMGMNDKAEAVFDNPPESLQGVILYAKNKQFDAKKVFIKVLKLKPNEFISLKYLAHIYYRTGWFNKAEKVYAVLIGKEWRDTELYYLLSERCEMRVRYFKFEMARKDADRIIKEYPQRPDFIVSWISWLLEHDNLAMVERYIGKLSEIKTPYEKSLSLFAKGLIAEFKLQDKNALSFFQQANLAYPSSEYNEKIKTAETNLKVMPEDKAPKLGCNKYEIKKISPNNWFIESKLFGDQRPVRYFVGATNGVYNVNLKLNFLYSKEINFNEREVLWTNYADKFWSKDGLKLNIESIASDTLGDSTSIKVQPWPSSFYSKRVSSHEWSVLTPPRMIAHEIGHLLGLDDEYYESDMRILKRNIGRYMGSRTSIMRNMLSGYPEKRHIHFILSPIKCN